MTAASEPGWRWGGVVPVRTGATVDGAVRSWAGRHGLRRVMLIRSRDPNMTASAYDLVAALEAAGLAVFPFDHQAGASTAAVAEGVGAFHFDQCQGVIGVGGASIIELATLVALMSGQRHPLPDLAADREKLAPTLTAPCLAIATDLSGVAAFGGARILMDDRGCPFLLRDMLLRPGEAAYCPSGGEDRPAEIAALAVDAGAESESGLETVRALMSGTPADRLSAACRIAGLLERAIGPARVFAAYAEVAADIPQSRTLAALLDGRGEVATAIAETLGDPAPARSTLETLPLDALAFVDPVTLPVDFSGVLAMLGRDIPAPRRRRGRGGSARGRNAE